MFSFIESIQLRHFPIGNVILQVFIEIVYKQSVDFFEENIIHNSRCLIVNDNLIPYQDMIFSSDYHMKLTLKSVIFIFSRLKFYKIDIFSLFFVKG